MSPAPSSAADAKTLNAAIKSLVFARAYYLYGDDDYLKDEDVRRIVDAAVDPATRDFNLELLRGGDVAAEMLGSILGTPPMMAERRVVVVRDVHALKKDARATLDRYLKNPAPDLLLVLVAPSGAKADKELTARATSIEYKPLSGSRIPKWIAYYVQHTLKSTITTGAITLLQESVGTDLAQLKIELDKAEAYTSGATINEAAVAAVVGVQPGETTGDFMEAIARRDAAAALAMLPVVLQQPKSSAVTIVMALTSQTMVIGWAQASRDRGAHPSQLSGDIYTLLKTSGSVFTGRSWTEFVSTCVQASATWSPEAIDAGLERLLQTDMMLKGPRVSSDEQLLASLVLSLCGVTSRSRAA
ncbi:MAG TPA: DNA polymerase III subunit delta [Gemmatimonadaceae bacterium]|jgi:DNA polymerase-3 subunit delta|nr:DNA polymerase III subunit delta [Gemmatimonadaceae bacterium]